MAEPKFCFRQVPLVRALVCRLKLLNGNLLIAGFIRTQKSKAAKRVLLVHPRSINAAHLPKD